MRQRRLHDKAARTRIGNAERAQRHQCQRLNRFALVARGIRRQRADKAFDQEAEQACRRERCVLIGQMAAGARSSDALGKFAGERFAEFANDEVCPVLDSETGLCDLYDARPMPCRTFGPPVRTDGGLGVCELCFHGASDEQIAACEMVVDSDDVESKLLGQLEKTKGARGRTIVAFCVK